MGFIDSYKQLEKLCGEVLNDDRRVSAYIDEMINTPNGAFYVSNWDKDLKKLKHYRWVRNKISHEPGCSELNMCEPADELWLDDFYRRISNQTDPLALYHKAISRKTAKQIQAQCNTKDTQPHVDYSDSQQEPSGCAAFLILTLFIVIIIFAFLLSILL